MCTSSQNIFRRAESSSMTLIQHGNLLVTNEIFDNDKDENHFNASILRNISDDDKYSNCDWHSNSGSFMGSTNFVPQMWLPDIQVSWTQKQRSRSSHMTSITMTMKKYPFSAKLHHVSDLQMQTISPEVHCN